MRQYVATNLTLLALHNLDVGFHALFCKRTCEQIANVRVRVQTTELGSNQVSTSSAAYVSKNLP
jgi:hypothetical protein